MAMSDVFGEYASYMESRAQRPDDADQTPATPLDEPAAETAQPIRFDGFSSGRPWYVDKPTAYIGRMNGVANLILVDEGDEDGNVGSPLAGMLFTPTLPLPCPAPDERYAPASDDALAYPLIDLPENVESSGDPVVDMLAWTLMLDDMGLMVETADGGLLCYEIEPGFECDPALWDAYVKEAETLAPRLLAVNMARLILFAMMDRAGEANALRSLFDAWGVPTDGQTTLRWVQDGILAGEFVRQEHETSFPDSDDHDPFGEFHGFPAYERALRELEEETPEDAGDADTADTDGAPAEGAGL